MAQMIAFENDIDGESNEYHDSEELRNFLRNFKVFHGLDPAVAQKGMLRVEVIDEAKHLNEDELDDFGRKLNMTVIQREGFKALMKILTESKTGVKFGCMAHINMVTDHHTIHISATEDEAMRDVQELQPMILAQQKMLQTNTEHAAKMIQVEFEEMIAMLQQKQQEMEAELHKIIEHSQQDLVKVSNYHQLVQKAFEDQNDLLINTSIDPSMREEKIVELRNVTMQRVNYGNIKVRIPEIKLANVDAVKQNILSMELNADYSSFKKEMELQDLMKNIAPNKSKPMVRFSNKDETQSILMDSCEVSAKSDRFDGEDMMGIVLYQYDKKTEWILNGIKCKSGFIYLCKSDKLENISSHPIDTMHARCFKYLFGVDPDYRKIVGAGCGYKDGKWKYNSSTFCAPENRQNTLAHHYGTDEFKDDWHDDNRAMHDIERKLLDEAITKWMKNVEESKYVTWSWWRYDWISYDEETNELIEREYRKYLGEELSVRNDTYCIRLNVGAFKTNIKLKDYQYKLYFSAPSISFDAGSIHNPNNPKWKNDKDKNNTYFLQQNVDLDYYRIVRRRCQQDIKK